MKNRNMEYIEEIKEVARTCILPNGDHIDVITQLWLEDLIERIDEPYFGWCDVEGREEESCSGGSVWKETGYWGACTKHAYDYGMGKPQPKMKQAAIKREKSRDKKTGYLPERKIK